MDVEFSSAPLRQSKSQRFPDLSTRSAVPPLSSGLRISMVTLDLLHCLFRRPQTNDRAQVSMNVHIQHLGSEIRRNLCSRNFAQRESLTLQEILSRTRNEARRVSCDQDPFSYAVILWLYCQSVEPTSTPHQNLLSQQMKSPSHAPLPSAYPSASADDIAGDPCVRLQVMIVQPPSCATPADVDLRST